jgi:hypothetical protein
MICAHIENVTITLEAVLMRVRLIKEQLTARGREQPATIKPRNEKQRLPTIVVDNAENPSVSKDGGPGHAACPSSVSAQ